MLKIVCIGAGRLAQQLMPALKEAGYDIVQVYNRSAEAARLLGDKLGSVPYTSSFSAIEKDADIYFIP
jgi:predicted dehydrogenase